MVLIIIYGNGNTIPVFKHDIMEAYVHMEESPVII